MKFKPDDVVDYKGSRYIIGIVWRKHNLYSVRSIPSGNIIPIDAKSLDDNGHFIRRRNESDSISFRRSNKIWEED